MSESRPPGFRRARPLFGVVLVVAGAAMALSPVVPGVRANDPAPSADAPGPTLPSEPSADPTVTPTPVPAPEPTPDLTPSEPTPAPPDPTTPADPTPAPSAAPTSPAAAVDPAALPADAPAGWVVDIAEDFDAAAAEGGFAAAYPDFVPYKRGWYDTTGVGAYNPAIASVRDSTLRIRMHTSDGVPQVFAMTAWPTGAGWRGGLPAMRVETRMRADRMIGYKGVPMLWADEATSNDLLLVYGGIDWPEGNFDAQPRAYMHRTNATGFGDQDVFRSPDGTTWQEWHTYAIEWRAGDYAQFEIDGQVIGRSTERVPTTPMHANWRFETNLERTPIDPTVSGSVEIDWIRVLVPTDSPSSPPVPDPTPAPGPSGTPAPDPSPTPTPEPIGLRTTHSWFERLDADGKVVDRSPVDATSMDLEPFSTYRVWYQVVNGTDVGVELGGQLEIAPDGGGAARAVPVLDAVAGEPFYAAGDPQGTDRSWVEAVRPGDFRLDTSVDPGARPVDGLLSFGQNPAGGLILPAHSYAEMGFTIRVTGDAAYGSRHALTLTDGGVALSSGVTALAAVAADPAVDLSPDQQDGSAAGRAMPFYRLAGDFAPLANPGPPYASPHFDLTLSGDSCAACHASHVAQQAYLLATPTTIADTCFACHDGSGALADVKSEYTDPTVPANQPASATWYSHPSLGDTGHVSDRGDEFSARLNRHAACVDCHQPHLSDDSSGVQSTSGWTASGAIRGASGVSVVNGAAGTAPAYTLTPTTVLEYQLCFKCHSGYTQLAAGATDKGVEFNPANGSYHPIEAAGKNTTSKMAASLAGSSPYKLWNFATTGTVRCTHCHGNPRTREPGTPAADARQAPHSSQYEGILIANYRRTPKEQDEPYDPADFALCLTCHGEGGILGVPSQTNFSEHGLHVASMEANGLALCSECHANSHSTATRRPAQTGSTSRLVSFGPSVSPYLGVLRWQSTGLGEGTCTLVCHGYRHDPENYRP